MAARDLDLMSLERRVEALLAPFAAKGSPGCTIGIVRDGALVLHRSAGLASIEHEVPVGPSTTFRIASVTKQFTCAAALLLAEDGVLSPEDDLAAFIPELPDLGARVTVDHVMRNTSGIRDMLELMRLGGLDLSDACTGADLLAAICRQRGLNFAPGSRFLYSNSGFFLLGLAVERAAGMPLGAFLEQRIFTPLGMTRTRLTPTTSELVPGLATGYLPATGNFTRAAHGFALGGEGGLVSCVEDLALWARNYETGRVGGPALVEALQQRARFTNGALNLYARGLEAGEHRGVPTIGHGGLWPGYKTAFLRAPAERLAVIVITNHGGADPGAIAAQVLEAALAGTAGLTPVPPLPAHAALEAMTGRWVNAGEGASFDVFLDPAGQPMARSHGVPFALAPLPDGALTARRGVFCFTLRPAGAALEVEADAGQRSVFQRAPAEAAMPENLPGRYACAELGTEWTIGDDRRVSARGPHAVGGPWRLEPVAPGLLRMHVPGSLFDTWYDIRLLPGGALEANGARARRLVFERIS
ncbi:serine hydrolase domain-containing protein [Neoroseomonas soli]|uniref:Beta-lactamase family protein n=1 Tax=Neoroseomonas soli TaxID=1081025 RepID=A0A9X9WUR5_9PROT|nr:serine hydrolase domain-containing protein [Neoroseomonas soli]MBR0670894.1 beta-lactamase family protein [Neoroseomonas soli]